ncbi:YkvA family protein [Paenibacillus agaridevorans]|uniref:YkvA family protein n=1 Tax=Paenibacillus agaridevorans TaxID=171404 RepID=UPI001BE4CE21|nr:YkvA family protein [Paenibacillus agaridevorans]
MDTLKKLRSFARKLKNNLFVLYLSYKDPRTPLFAKIVAICVVAYAFSPIDLIPDFIPVLGYLDDLILVPLGIALALKLVPSQIIEDSRVRAQEMKKNGKPKNWFVGTLFITVWILFAIWIGKLIYNWLS